MVLKMYKGGNMVQGMRRHWRLHGPVPIGAVQNISRMVFRSVAWLHQHGVLHRDIKGDNFLTDRRALEDPACHVCLADFGTATRLQPGTRLKDSCGTKDYWAPELHGGRYSFPVDVWAAGVVAFGLVFARFPFHGRRECQKQALQWPSERAPEEVRDFLLQVLQKDEAQRLTAAQALAHRCLHEAGAVDEEGRGGGGGIIDKDHSVSTTASQTAAEDNMPSKPSTSSSSVSTTASQTTAEDNMPSKPSTPSSWQVPAGEMKPERCFKFAGTPPKVRAPLVFSEGRPLFKKWVAARKLVFDAVRSSFS